MGRVKPNPVPRYAPKCCDVECEAPLMEHTSSRKEQGRELQYKFHSCIKCGLVQPTADDLAWSAEQQKALEARIEQDKKVPWQARVAYVKAWLWCFWVSGSVLRPTVTRKTYGDNGEFAGPVVAVTATDREHKITRVFWEAE